MGNARDRRRDGAPACACESLPLSDATPAQLLAAAECPHNDPEVADALRRAAARVAKAQRTYPSTRGTGRVIA